MKKIEIKYFKGFGEKEIKIEIPNEESLLICGENGTGKSSFYDAIKVIFFHNKLFKAPAIYRDHEKEEWISKQKALYYNLKYGRPFEIKVDGEDYSMFNISNYEVFMISNSGLEGEDRIEINSLLEKMTYEPFDLDDFIKEMRIILCDYVNHTLKEEYHESVTIDISASFPYTVTVKDESRNLSMDNDLKLYFNESKLRLIKLNLLLGIITGRNIKKNGRNLIVVDDVLSSIDAANRSIFIRNLYRDFMKNNYRIFFLTHNLSLYRSLMYYVNNLTLKKEKVAWKAYQFYELEGEPAAYPYPLPEDIKVLESQLKTDIQDGNTLDDIGNKIRKRFEMVVHQVALLMLIGEKGLPPWHILFNKLEKDEFLCYKNGEFLRSNDIVEDIELILKAKNSNKEKVIEDYLRKIKYGEQDILHIKECLSQLALIQKLTLHPMSHSADLVLYSKKELELAIELLKKLDSIIVGYRERLPSIG